MREWDITREEVEANRIGNQIFATVDYLLPYTYLEARVAVMNNYYVGRPSDIVQFRTDEGGRLWKALFGTDYLIFNWWEWSRGRVMLTFSSLLEAEISFSS